MKRNGFTLLQAVLLIAAVLILAVIFFAVRGIRGPVPNRRSSCQWNLKVIALAFKQYNQDYKECFPCAMSGDAFESKSTWPDVLEPYIMNQQIFSCPSDTAATKKEFISYGYNSNLGSKNESKMNNSAWIILNYEVTGSKKATCGNTTAAVTAPTRHLEGANYSFVDGHVKWLKPEKISNTAIDANTPSFIVH